MEERLQRLYERVRREMGEVRTSGLGGASAQGGGVPAGESRAGSVDSAGGGEVGDQQSDVEGLVEVVYGGSTSGGGDGRGAGGVEPGGRAPGSGVGESARSAGGGS